MPKLCLFLVCLIASLPLHAQSKKIKIKDAQLKNSYELFTVLEYNPDVKNGPYKRVIQGNVAVEGMYLENRKGGIWKWYNNDGEESIVNYNTHVIHYPVKNGFLVNWYDDDLAATDNRPVIKLTSDDVVYNVIAKTLRYPVYARERGIQGKVVIGIIIDESGRIKNYKIATSVDTSLDNAAINIVKTIPLDFIPAYKKGKAITDEYLLPVMFRLQ